MTTIKAVKLNNFEIGGDKLSILAGPCAIENKDVLFKVAESLKKITQELDINYVFKSSKHARSIQSQKRALANDGRQIHRVKK
mgnify:FL=1